MQRPRLAALIAFALALTGQACTASERLVELPDGRRIFMRCEGTGSPVVLFESGYRGGAGAWAKLQPALARTTKTCAYDRAGYGRSDPGPLPRDGAAVARDLDAALRAERIDGPFVMVGHSAGGLYARLFSNLRPRDVVGMVLVDPSVEHQDQRFAAAFGGGAGGTDPLRAQAARCYEAAQAGLLPSDAPGLKRCTPRSDKGRSDDAFKAAVAEGARATTWSTAMSELDTLWTSTSQELDQGRASYGDIPLIVLTAGGTYAAAPEPARDASEALWRRLHQEIAARSSRGEERLVDNASHMIMNDRPEAVIAAVREVVAEARSGRGR
jgi:pimeloyl-ACP methyl ester carboxylesterase